MTKMMAIFSIVIYLNAFAEPVSINGTITKAGGSEGIAGAHVSLKNYPFVAAYSGESGAYNLTGNTRALVNFWMTENSDIAIRSARNNTGLLIRLRGSRSNAAIAVYKINGRLVASRRFTEANAGDYFVPFAKSAHEAYIVKVKSGNECRMFKMVPTMAVSCAVVSGIGAGASRNAGLGKTSGSVSDSIVVAAQGFRTALEAVTFYEKDNVDISITASNPWVPTAAPERLKGMVRIMAKGRDFEMGQPVDTIWGIDGVTGDHTSADEQPVHTVTFAHDFWMDTTEVKQGEFDTLMKLTYQAKYETPKWDATHGLGNNYPASMISWGTAALYCNALSKSEGLDTVYSYGSIAGLAGAVACELKNVSVNTSSKSYRLPTEAEWEYASKGGTFTDYYWSKNFSYYQTASVLTEIDSYAVWAGNSKNKGSGNQGYGLHFAATTLPNKYGLYDMAGNISEWCHGDKNDFPWGEVPDSVGPVKGNFHPIRGGNWGNDASYLRSQCRMFNGSADYFPFFQGFRVARTAED